MVIISKYDLSNNKRRLFYRGYGNSLFESTEKKTRIGPNKSEKLLSLSS